jgi:sarcosine oxidase subunit beta
MERADVVIVGGGAIGTSIAFHLAEAGVNVLLAERAELGAGSTARGAGGVRAMFSDELNVRIGLRSLEAWNDFARRPGGEIDFERVGYLFLLTEPHEVEEFERCVALMRSLGAPAEMLSRAEAKRRSPLASSDGVLAAAFCPLGGHVTPDAVVQGYAAGARAHGARIETGREVTGVDLGDRAVHAPRSKGGTAARGAESDRAGTQSDGSARGLAKADLDVSGAAIRGVRTTRGPIEADTVICAAGAWSAALGAMAGVQLDVSGERRRIAYTGPIADLPGEIPMTIEFASGLYFHREGPGLLFGTGSTAEGEAAWLEASAPLIARRVPALVDAPIAGGWSGLYEMTPDHNALIGEAPTPTRFLYATGFSGHGFQQAPAVGEIVRDLYLGRRPFVDVGPLAADRDSRNEHNVV